LILIGCIRIAWSRFTATSPSGETSTEAREDVKDAFDDNVDELSDSSDDSSKSFADELEKASKS